MAFKASPSSQHQHCCDEAQKAETVLSAVIFFYLFIIVQARGQDGWILANFSFCVFMDRNEVELHKNVKGEQGQYPASLTELTKGFIAWHKEHCKK